MKDNLMQRLYALLPNAKNMELPPKVFVDMEGEFIDFVENEKLVARFPNKERYRNPYGFMQGGILVAAMDNTMSPLSYTVAAPSITKEITTEFKRPVKLSDEYIDVVATILEKTSSHILMQAETLNAKGKLMARSVSHCVYLRAVSDGNV